MGKLKVSFQPKYIMIMTVIIVIDSVRSRLRTLWLLSTEMIRKESNIFPSNIPIVNNTEASSYYIESYS